MTPRSSLSRPTLQGEQATSDKDRRFALLVAMMMPQLWRRGAENDLTLASEPIMSDERPIVTEGNKERIRAGATGHNVRYVVMASVALTVIAFLIVFAFIKH